MARARSLRYFSSLRLARKGATKTQVGISCSSCWPITCFGRESQCFATTSAVSALRLGDFDKATFDDLVSDAAAAFHYLKSRPEVDPHRAGVIGHSEGGSIGPAVAVTDKDVAFVVAMAGSGLSGEFRIIEHWAFVAEEGGASPEQQEKVRAMGRQIFRVVAATSDDAVASGRIAALVDAAVADKALEQGEAADIRQLMTPQFVRMELNDNPLSYLKQVSVPVLALVGSLDHTVPAGPYVEVMRPVLETIPGSKLEVLPGLNHVMQTAQTGSPRESGSSKESISPLALRAIGDWIAEQVQRPRETVTRTGYSERSAAAASLTRRPAVSDASMRRNSSRFVGLMRCSSKPAARARRMSSARP